MKIYEKKKQRWRRTRVCFWDTQFCVVNFAGFVHSIFWGIHARKFPSLSLGWVMFYFYYLHNLFFLFCFFFVIMPRGYWYCCIREIYWNRSFMTLLICCFPKSVFGSPVMRLYRYHLWSRELCFCLHLLI